MTRFWISLTEGVELVIKALEEATGGETFISKIPSFKVTDLAEAMLPGCKMPEIGIRPGEKLHEIMVTVEDSSTTYEYDKHFIVYPQVVWNDKQKINLSGQKVEEGSLLQKRERVRIRGPSVLSWAVPCNCYNILPVTMPYILKPSHLQ